MRLTTLCLALLVGSACDADPPASNADLIGTDLESEDVIRAAVTFADSPQLSLGGIDVVGPTQFSGVPSIEVGPDGSLWVVDAATQQLRVFSSEGSHLFSVGGRGDGPGEFRGLNFVGAEPDGTMMAVDSELRRVTRYAQSGRLLGTMRWQAPGRVRAIGVTGEGLLVGVTQPSWPVSALDRGGVYSDTTHVLAWAELDQPADTVVSVPGLRSVVSRTGASILPFSRMPATAMGDQLHLSAGPLAEIQVFGPDSLERRISVDRAPTSVASVRDDYVAGLRANRSADQVRAALQRLEHPEVPEYISAYSDLVVTSTGYVWAERVTYTPELDGEWDVFDPSGQLLGQVRPPEGFLIRSIDGDLVTGVSVDEFGVPYVQQWETTRW